MELRDFEARINRGVLSSRSKRLDAVVLAVKDFGSRQTEQDLVRVGEALKRWKHEDPKEYADRGQPVESDLKEAIRRAGQPWWGFGRIPLVDRSSNPRYEPQVWNDNGRVQFSTNCYAYACNDPFHHASGQKPQPGTHMHQSVNQTMTHSAVRFAVMKDDLSRNHLRTQRLIPLVRLRQDMANTNLSDIEVANVPGHYLIALVVAPNQDYHWYRQDDTGYWSHKPGHTTATNLDASGRRIVDPRECNLGIYTFTTFYFAPKGGVRTASLGDWTNPNWRP